MSKLSNTLTMLQLLQDGKKYSIRELSEILEVSDRMIRIYKEDLDKSGIYIETIKGPYGGYVMGNKFKLPVRKFNEEDLDTLEKLIIKETDEKLKEDILVIKNKIKGIYIKRKQEDETIIDNDFNKKFNFINKSIKQKKQIKITYYSFNKGPNERIIEPLEMFLFSDIWHCKAFCQNRKAIRHFEIKRIIKYEIIN